MKKTASIVLLALVIILLVFNKAIFTSTNLKLIVSLFFGLGLIGILGYDSYRTIRKKEYTTSLYIFLANLIAIMSLVGAAFYAYRSTSETNPQVLNYIGTYILSMQVLFFIALVARTFLKNPRFKK